MKQVVVRDVWIYFRNPGITEVEGYYGAGTELILNDDFVVLKQGESEHGNWK